MTELIQVPEVRVFAFGRYSDEQKEVINELIKYNQALIRKDFDYLISVVDPKASYMTPAGRFRKIEEDLFELNTSLYKKATMQAPHAFLFGNKALVQAITHFSGRKGRHSGVFANNIFYSLEKQDGKWRFVQSEDEKAAKAGKKQKTA